ncbi:MAG TPA: hypothetical protein P5555_05965 [Candidatus Paceibacterota bacterium]|nr:hypothetical protein [Verrucomicrobiota bacterium]HRZ44716.1 hypothetical protein [Candidatus Paceibacterota bacterium]HRZ92848.1 hypothetical protein [Candidatus Paceibacterota bacterium]
MQHDSERQIPIWFFIGALLVLYGVIILGTGVYQVVQPPEKPLALAHLHAGVWWGALMVAVGSTYVWRFRPGR